MEVHTLNTVLRRVWSAMVDREQGQPHFGSAERPVRCSVLCSLANQKGGVVMAAIHNLHMLRLSVEASPSK